MSNIIPFQLFDKSTANRCMKHGVFIAILICFLSIGCKSSDKSKSVVPFFGGGTTVNSPADEFPPGQQPIASGSQVIVQEGPGPATPSSPVLSAMGVSASTSSVPNAYSPPDNLVPTGQTTSQTTYSPDNTTMVYSPSPGTNTNSGGTAGSIPNTYSASGYGTGTSGAPSSSYSYSGSSTPATGSSAYSSGSSSNTGSQTGSTPSSTGSSSSNSSSYGGTRSSDTTTGSGYNSYGPKSGYNTSFTPSATAPLDDGDYLASDGTMKRVINGKTYELVQYNYRNPPIVPEFSGSGITQPPAIPQTSTTIQPTNDYRTATQMTQSFGQVPIPTYESLLSQQASGAQVLPQGVVTIADAARTTIVPESVSVETVPSLTYSEYSEIGAITTSSSTGDNESVANDDEMRRSIWSMMASQNNNYLLYNAQSQSVSDKNDQPTYFPLSNPLAGYANQTNGITASGLSGSSIYPGQQPSSYIFYETTPRLFLCPR